MLLGSTGVFRGSGTQYATYDTSHIPPAGKRRERDEMATTAACMKFEGDAEAPDRVKPYLGPNQQEPGRTFKHFGTARDPEPQGPFGMDTRPDPEEGVQHLMKQGPQDDVGRWKHDQAEQIYASTRREPLGRAYERGFKLPEGLGTDRAFGLPVNAVALDKEGQVREVMQSGPGKDDGATRELYRRTHGHYAPGEQRVRGYDWGGQDPNAVVFGRPPQAHDDTEIARVLAHEAGRGAAVVPAVLADFKATRADELGRVRTQGYGDRACVAEPAGIASTRFEEMGVEALLKHQAGSAGLEPDADLGRSLRPGFRNMTRAGDEDRSFGVPSVRVDLPAPRGTLSMANATNFGNEPDAASLVFPSAGVDRGIGDEVMSRATSLDEVRDIVASAGVEADDDILEEAFQIAVAETGRCTLVGFLKAKAQVERVRAGL